MTCHVGGGRVTCTGAEWAANLAPGQPQTAGLQVNDTAAGPAHPALTVSG